MIDITHRKRIENKIEKSLEEKDVLIRDIHNSVKNNLEMFSTLFCLQSTYIPDKKIRNMFQESGNRVRVLALIYEKLYQSDDLTSIEFGDYLKSLVEMLFNFYESKKDIVDYQVNSEEIFMDIGTAIPMGLIANELVSNSLKHAFSEDMKGEIRIQLDDADSNMVMDVWDSGVGLPNNFNFKKTGNLRFKIVNNLVKQISAEIGVKNEPGAHFIMNVPKYSLRQ